MNDDFTFDFPDEVTHLDESLHMICLEEFYYIGHLIEDTQGNTWMLSPYYVHEDDDGVTVDLHEVPHFMLDPMQEVIIISNADEMRILHSKHSLSLGFISNIPFVCNSTRH